MRDEGCCRTEIIGECGIKILWQEQDLFILTGQMQDNLVLSTELIM